MKSNDREAGILCQSYIYIYNESMQSGQYACSSTVSATQQIAKSGVRTCMQGQIIHKSPIHRILYMPEMPLDMYVWRLN